MKTLDMKTLDIVLKREWYDMIDSGVKKEEYRDIKPYWIRRLTDLKSDFIPFSYREGYQTIPFKDFTHVLFHRAYTSTTMLFSINGMSVGIGNSSWGAPDKEVFIIKLGDRQ